MKVPYITLDDLSTLRASIPAHLSHYTEANSDWIETELGHKVLLDSKYECPDIVLNMDADEPFDTEFENVKMVYETLKFLSDSEASNERLWAGLALGPFWRYVQYRWKLQKDCTENNIKQHFYYGFGSRRSLIRNGAARLWWIGRLTYDDTKPSDPYELTRFVCEKSNYVMSILERNFSNNKAIVRPCVRAFLDARKEGYDIKVDEVKTLTKYISVLGGVYVLDCLPEQLIHDKLMDEIRRRYKKN